MGSRSFLAALQRGPCGRRWRSHRRGTAWPARRWPARRWREAWAARGSARGSALAAPRQPRVCRGNWAATCCQPCPGTKNPFSGNPDCKRRRRRILIQVFMRFIHYFSLIRTAIGCVWAGDRFWSRTAGVVLLHGYGSPPGAPGRYSTADTETAAILQRTVSGNGGRSACFWQSVNV